MHLSPPDALYFPRRLHEVRIQTSGRAAPGFSDLDELKGLTNNDYQRGYRIGWFLSAAVAILRRI